MAFKDRVCGKERVSKDAGGVNCGGTGAAAAELEGASTAPWRRHHPRLTAHR